MPSTSSAEPEVTQESSLALDSETGPRVDKDVRTDGAEALDSGEWGVIDLQADVTAATLHLAHKPPAPTQRQIQPPSVYPHAGMSSTITPSSAFTAPPRRPYSSGTLRMDRGGQSRYLGPTAALRWLQDVSSRYGRPNADCCVARDQRGDAYTFLVTATITPRLHAHFDPGQSWGTVSL